MHPIWISLAVGAWRISLSHWLAAWEHIWSAWIVPDYIERIIFEHCPSHSWVLGSSPIYWIEGWIFRKGIDGINGFSRKTIKLVVMGAWESVMLLQHFLVLIIPIIKPINVYGSGGRRLIHVCYVIIILDVILFSGPLCLYFTSYEVARTKPRMTSRDINFHNWVLWWEGSLTFPTHCI